MSIASRSDAIRVIFFALGAMASVSSAHGSKLAEALCSIAIEAKAAYEAAYESAELRGGSELEHAAAGAEDMATIGEVALHAITQCEWLIEQCRGVPGAPTQLPSSVDAARASKPSSSANAMDDDMPDWLLSAASDLAPDTSGGPDASAGPTRSASFQRRRKRTPKVAD